MLAIEESKTNQMRRLNAVCSLF